MVKKHYHIPNKIIREVYDDSGYDSDGPVSFDFLEYVIESHKINKKNKKVKGFIHLDE